MKGSGKRIVVLFVFICLLVCLFIFDFLIIFFYFGNGWKK